MPGVKKLTTILLILAMSCVSLSANTHVASVSHDQHEGTHYHFQLESGADSDSSVFESGLQAHDPTSHSHLSLDILIFSEDHVYTAYKNPWEINLHTVYISQTLSPPVPPPNT